MKLRSRLGECLDLVLESVALRHQLMVCERSRGRRARRMFSQWSGFFHTTTRARLLDALR